MTHVIPFHILPDDELAGGSAVGGSHPIRWLRTLGLTLCAAVFQDMYMFPSEHGHEMMSWRPQITSTYHA